MSEALARSFNQWNKMLIDQQQWDTNREIRNQEFQLKSVLLEEQAKDAALARDKLKLSMQGMRQQQQLAQYQLEEEEAFRTPGIQSIYPIVGRDWAGSKDGREKMQKLWADQGVASFSVADGIPLDAAGNPVPISGQMMANKLPMMDFIDRANRNTPMRVANAQASAEKDYSEASNRYKKLSKNRRYGSRADLTAAKNDMENAKTRYERATQALTPAAMAGFYGREADEFAGAASYFNQFGDAAKEQVNYLQNQSNTFRSQQNYFLAQMAKDIDKSKVKTKYVVGVDPDKDDYKTVKRAIKIMPGTSDADYLQEGEAAVDTPPWLSDKARGIGGEGGAKGKQPTPYNYNQGYDDIAKRYSDADTGMILPGAGINDMFETHRKTYDILAQHFSDTMPDDNSRFRKARSTADNYIRAQHNAYTTVVDSVEKMTTDRAFQDQVVNSLVLKGQGKSHNEYLAEFGEAVKATQGTPNAMPQTREAFKNWFQDKWKFDFAHQINSQLGKTVMSPADVYLPLDFERDMAQLQRTLRINRN